MEQMKAITSAVSNMTDMMTQKNGRGWNCVQWMTGVCPEISNVMITDRNETGMKVETGMIVVGR